MLMHKIHSKLEEDFTESPFKSFKWALECCCRARYWVLHAGYLSEMYCCGPYGQ